MWIIAITVKGSVSGTNSKREKAIKAELTETGVNPARLPCWLVFSGVYMCVLCVEVTGQPWALVLLETGSPLLFCIPVYPRAVSFWRVFLSQRLYEGALGLQMYTILCFLIFFFNIADKLFSAFYFCCTYLLQINEFLSQAQVIEGPL